MSCNYSADDLNKMLAKWVVSPDGQEYLEDIAADLPAYDVDFVKKVARELIAELRKAYLNVVADPYTYFATDEIIIKDRGQTSAMVNGYPAYHIDIFFPKKFLYRPSLFKPPYMVEQTGSGVYDIFGLLTQGYDAHRPAQEMPQGIWCRRTSIYDDYTDSPDDSYVARYIRAKRSRDGDPFITHTIKKFEQKYPQIQFNYPREWGGNK